MVTQFEILEFLKDIERKVTFDQIRFFFDSPGVNLSKQIRELNRFGFISISIGNDKKYYVKYEVKRDGFDKGYKESRNN